MAAGAELAATWLPGLSWRRLGCRGRARARPELAGRPMHRWRCTRPRAAVVRSAPVGRSVRGPHRHLQGLGEVPAVSGPLGARSDDTVRQTVRDVLVVDAPAVKVGPRLFGRPRQNGEWRLGVVLLRSAFAGQPLCTCGRHDDQGPHRPRGSRAATGRTPRSPMQPVTLGRWRPHPT